MEQSLKDKIVAILITAIIVVILLVIEISNVSYKNANALYQVYLDGNKIGVIADADSLYNLINDEQSDIKTEYNVDNVYPPNGFEIEKIYTYDQNVTTVDSIYNEIKDSKDFTIKGYTITIKGSKSATADEGNEEVEAQDYTAYIHVLDKAVFDQALNNILFTFVDETEYNNYMNDTQPAIIDTGSLIENMYFKEGITIKEDYVSVNDKIYTDPTELTKYLLFGENYKEEDYTVKSGDTIESIAYDHKLNAKEFLIANPTYKDASAVLAIGEQVNISLINPLVSLVKEMYVVEDVEEQYETVIKYDNSKASSYSQTTQVGVNGINRISKRTQVINGEEIQGAVVDQSATVVIRQTVNQIVTKGRKVSYGGGTGNVTGTYIDTGDTWAWPTNRPYIISSGYGYRGGSFHPALDITGTGYGSPIYAALGGTVISAQYGGMVGSAAGNNVVIQHPNGYYTVYAHLSAFRVSVGQTVSRGQVIGLMGRSGYATGTHLHFSVYIGMPYSGGKSINPWSLWK